MMDDVARAVLETQCRLRGRPVPPPLRERDPMDVLVVALALLAPICAALVAWGLSAML